CQTLAYCPIGLLGPLVEDHCLSRLSLNRAISLPLLPRLREVSLRRPLIWLARLPVGPNGGKAWRLVRMRCHASTPLLGMLVSSRRLWPMLGAPSSYSSRARPVACSTRRFSGVQTMFLRFSTE